MKERCNRAILFAKVNDEKANLLSLITMDEHAIALSDEQISRIDDMLMVCSLSEFEEKFDINFGDIEPEASEKHMAIHAVEEFYQTLSQGQQAAEYRLWYYAKEKQEKQSAGSFSVKLYELWLGIKSYFEQGRGQQQELLVTNMTYEEWQAKQADEKLRLYIETVNDKLENDKEIAYAIFPQIPITVDQKQDVRERFEGKRTVGASEEISYEILAELMQILARGQVISCYQYETGEGSSAKRLAREGRYRFQKEAELFAQRVQCTEISCCYPNLTWIEDKIYIGAAYIVAGMLTAGKQEKDMTTLPRELYPYTRSVQEELREEAFGSMLACADSPFEARMCLYSARSQQSEQGEYQQIERNKNNV